MIKLVNVKRKGNIIEANYIPIVDEKEEVGYIKMDLETHEVIESKETSYDIPGIQTMLVHASLVLPHIADDKPFKEEYIHRWF